MPEGEEMVQVSKKELAELLDAKNKIDIIDTTDRLQETAEDNGYGRPSGYMVKKGAAQELVKALHEGGAISGETKDTIKRGLIKRNTIAHRRGRKIEVTPDEVSDFLNAEAEIKDIIENGFVIDF